MLAGARTAAYVLVFLLLVAGVPVHAQAAPLPGLGMDQGSVAGLQQAGVPPVYGSYWVGVWMATHGWAGLDNALKSAKATGVTPVIYWYYWGDDISPSCVENGCSVKSKAQWVSMTQTLADKLQTHMGGSPVIVVLENEFNKGGITDAPYASTFDGYLEARAKTLKAVPGVSLSLGFGSWGESAWSRFPKAMAASDSIGFQLMRASTRDSEASYRGADDKIADTLAFIKQISGKPGFLYDVALSSYPDATYRTIQAETLASILDRRAEYAQTGLVGIVYRELKDNPSMGTHNYFGIAEQYWGFKDKDGNAKPSWDVWLKANDVQPPPPPPPPAVNLPGVFEAESMAASTGGRNAEPGASGGATWNLWTNGNLRQDLVAEQAGAYRLSVVARGVPAAGVDARMEVRLDGALLGAFTVPAGLREYVLTADLPAGRSVLSVAFVNDVRTATEDRNLYVDVVRVDAPPANRAPVARFASTPEDLSLSVDASGSTDADGDALAYRWTWGDGAGATGAQARHAYAQAGTYDVTLTVSDGKAESSATAAVTVVAPNRAPLAAFDLAGRDLDWTFVANASDPDGDALTYQWSFGDGSAATGAQAAHRYASAGAYTVTLRVSDGKATSDATRALAASEPNRAPLASFEVAGADLSWSFDARASSDPDGDALTYQWDFGDGSTATGAKASRTFETAGDRSVTLTVSDGEASSSVSRIVSARLPNRAPTAAFTVTGAALAWTFDARGSADPDGDALTYAWTFHDGTSATGAQAAKTYAAAGDFPVTLTVSDSKASATATQAVAARMPNRAPVANVTAAGADMTWSFDGSGSRDPDGDALTYEWTFSDGVTAGGVRVTRAFTTPGEHTARLTVSDGKGGSHEATATVTARAPAATRLMQAEAFQSKDNGAAFSDATASEGKGWLLWSDGAIRQAFNPGAGTYRVEVVAKGDEANGWPAMELRADGALVGRWTVSSSGWATYSANVAFQAGQAKTLSVHFTNDYGAPGMDRNLRVDLVRLVAPGVSVEAEAFQKKDNGAAFSDASASAGAGWLLWSNGGMSQKVAPGAGAWTVEVVAKGDQAAGAPLMELRADGAVVARWSVSSASWQTYKADVSMNGAGKTLSVHFLNDYKGPEGDRNLRVDAVRLVGK